MKIGCLGVLHDWATLVRWLELSGCRLGVSSCILCWGCLGGLMGAEARVCLTEMAASNWLRVRVLHGGPGRSARAPGPPPICVMKVEGEQTMPLASIFDFGKNSNSLPTFWQTLWV